MSAVNHAAQRRAEVVAPAQRQGDTVAPRTARTHGMWLPMLWTSGLIAATSVTLPPKPAQWLVAVAGVLAIWAVLEAMFSARAGLRGTVRLPITTIGIGLCITVAGEAMHAFGAAYPSAADIVELTAYPFFITGLLRLTRSRIRERAVDTLLIAAIVPATVGAFAWMPLLNAVNGWLPSTHRQPWLAVGFLVVDGLAIAMIARLAVLFRGKPIAFQFLLGSFACPLGAHVARSMAAVTGVVPAPIGSQSLMILGFGLLGAAALHPSLQPVGKHRVKPAPIGRGHLLLMGAAVVVGPVIAIWRYAHVGDWVVLAVGAPALISLLVVAHLGRMVRERTRLEYESSHDPLTGLLNRQAFHDRLVLAIGRGEPSGSQIAVGFLDLDRFKTVNDSLGHQAGDTLLRAVADRIVDAVRREDIVARLAGDEFGLILSGTSGVEDFSAVARRVLDQFERPFRVAGHELFTSPSIGLALYPDHGADAQTLLKRADEAMYRAKDAGRNTFVVYDDKVGSRAHQQLAVETGLHAAIANDELVLHYQPKLDLRTGAVTGVEALVRWHHPTIGMVAPNAFIRLAEESGLVAPLGEWVLRTACRQAATWHQAGRSLTVSVNLSARQFQLQDITGIVQHALSSSGLPPYLLELELTESISFEEQRKVSESLAELRGMGVRCSIDDFGTGHSGIGYLNDYPIDKIKLDRTFVASITETSDAPLVRAIIAMAHSLGLEVIAEGVETQEQLAFLQANGCDAIQGYLFSRPLAAEDMETIVEESDRPVVGIGLGDAARAGAAYPGAVGTEDELGEALWQQTLAKLANDPRLTQLQEALAPTTVGGQVKRTVVLTAAAGAMTFPMVVGLGSAGALPPQVQAAVSSTLDNLHVYTPDPGHGIASPADVGRHQKPVAIADAAPTAPQRPGTDETLVAHVTEPAPPVVEGAVQTPPVTAVPVNVPPPVRHSPVQQPPVVTPPVVTTPVVTAPVQAPPADSAGPAAGNSGGGGNRSNASPGTNNAGGKGGGGSSANPGNGGPNAGPGNNNAGGQGNTGQGNGNGNGRANAGPDGGGGGGGGGGRRRPR